MDDMILYLIILLSPVLAAASTNIINHHKGIPRIQRDVNRMVRCLCRTDPEFREAWEEELGKEWLKKTGGDNGNGKNNKDKPAR